MSDWVKIFNSLPAHPKVLRAGDRAAWLYVCGLCYANEHLTDGFIPREVLPVAAPGVKSPDRLAAKLVEVGLWHRTPEGWHVHDYEEHQRTSSQVKETRRKDRERKARKESTSDSARNPAGIHLDSVGEPARIPSETCADTRSQEKRREEKKEEREGSARATEPAQVDDVLEVLAAAPRLHVDRVGVENAVRAWPNSDPVRAAREVVTWVTDPAFRGTNAARLLMSALEKQTRPSAPKAEVHSFRPRRPQQGSAEDFLRIARGEG